MYEDLPFAHPGRWRWGNPCCGFEARTRWLGHFVGVGEEVGGKVSLTDMSLESQVIWGPRD